MTEQLTPTHTYDRRKEVKEKRKRDLKGLGKMVLRAISLLSGQRHDVIF